uniref:Uncharacterized protein n=1 Tax=Oryza brachyantha TaxID=4533 RepID=J3L4X6_ORYBR
MLTANLRVFVVFFVVQVFLLGMLAAPWAVDAGRSAAAVYPFDCCPYIPKCCGGIGATAMATKPKP